jgi:hypothetical protein
LTSSPHSTRKRFLDLLVRARRLAWTILLKTIMLRVAAICTTFASGSSATAQLCQPFWASTGTRLHAWDRSSAAVFNDGAGAKLYFTGSILENGSWTIGVVRWDGRRWERLSEGYPSSIQPGHLRVLDTGQGERLFLSGRSSGPTGSTTWMREWNGSSWVLTQAGLASTEGGWPYISLHEGSNPVLYGLSATSAQNNQVVRWTGHAWEIIGIADRHVTLFAAFDDGNGPKLHVVGNFTAIGGNPVRGVAKWTGSQWEPLGAGITSWKHPRDVAVHDDGAGPALYICDVLSAGGQSVNRIAKWNGQTWSSVGGGGIVTTGITEVYSLGSFDDGRGPALYVGGYISLAGGGVPIQQMARFNGQVWDNLLGGSAGGFPYQFVPFNDGRGPSLFAIGYFNTVGSGASNAASGVAQLVGCQSQCYADCDNSGSTSPRLNVDDFTCFINRYAFGDPYVDCNADGLRNIADFLCFLARFAEGCQ